MPWGVAAAVIAAGGAYYAAKEQSKGAKEAAQIQTAQQQKALEAQQAAIEPYQPYLMESLQRYQQLLEKPESFKTTPGYMFRLQEGLKAAGIAPGSRYLTGAQIKAAERYGQEYASAEYQTALNQAAGLGSLAAGTYQPAAQNAAALGNIYGNIGQALGQGVLGARQAQAAGYLGIGRAAQQGLQNYQLYRMYQNQPQTTGTGGNVSGQSAGATGGYYSSGYTPPGGVSQQSGTSTYSDPYGNYSGLTAYGEPEYG